jgi:hypothetical protein
MATSLQNMKRHGGPTNREPGHRSGGKFEKKGTYVSSDRNTTQTSGFNNSFKTIDLWIRAYNT